MKNSIPPVRKGQELTLTPFTLGSLGDSIAKINKYTIIIKGSSKIGEPVNIIIDEVHERYAYAKVL